MDGKVNWCKKSLVHIQLFFYYIGQRRWQSRAKTIQMFKDEFNIPEDDFSDASAQRCITELNRLYFKNKIENSTWCDSAMTHIQLFFYYRGMRRFVTDEEKVVQLFRDDFNFRFENGLDIIRELNKIIS